MRAAKLPPAPGEQEEDTTKATALELRLRVAIYLIVSALGFTAPWDRLLHLDGSGANAHVWAALSVLLAKAGIASVATAFNLVLVVGIVCAVAGAWLRTWAAAYPEGPIGRDTSDGATPSQRMVAEGPYRHVRNPLSVGLFLHTLALALLMPPSGAIFAMVVLGVFQMRLVLAQEVLAKEDVLGRELGAVYAEYCARVPRLLPSLRPCLGAAGAPPRWRQAVLAEIYVWGVALSFLAVGWRYNALLLTQCVVVCLGISLVVRALLPAGAEKVN